MNIRHFYSIDLDEEQPSFNHIAELPDGLLDWINDNQKEGIIIWDEKGKICFVSQSVERILGYTKKELLGKSWDFLFEMEQINKIIEHLNQDHHEKKTFRINVLNKEEKETYIEFVFQSVKDDQLGKKYNMSYLRDLSEYKAVKEMMLQAEKMSIVGQLGASIAHEIRNPLTSIKGFLQLLQAGVRYKDEYYKIMKDEIEKMEAITSELLSVARPITNNRELESVDKLIRDVVILLQYQAKLKNITITIVKQIGEFIYCDSSQIKQVLINLVKNAIEAMDEPGEIRVYPCSDESKISIYVEDEGIGVAAGLSDQLSVPFFTTKKNGTGLGLNITKEILELHGGSLHFSKNDGKGSTFQIVFPKVN